MNVFIGWGDTVYFNTTNNIELNLFLDHGPYLGDLYENRLSVFVKHYSVYDFDEQEIKSMLQRQLNNLEKIISCAKNGEPITIWRTDNLSCQCSFLFIVDQLKDMNCEINDVLLPNNVLYLDSIKRGKKEKLVNQCYHALTKNEIESFAELWQKSIKSNPSYLFYENGKLVSIEDNYYDDFILSCFTVSKMRTVELISKIWYNFTDKCNLGPDEWFVVNRVEELCKQGYIEKVKKSFDFRAFDYVLKKTSKLKDYQNSIKNYSKECGYDGVMLQTTMWRGYTVYEPFLEEPACVGLPHSILVKGNELRLTNEKEVFEVFKHLHPYNLEDYVGKTIYVLRRDGEEFFGSCKVRVDSDFGRELEFRLKNGNIQIINEGEIKKIEIIT